MPTLPQLIQEDVFQFDRVLKELLDVTESTTAMIIDKGGFLIGHQGDSEQFDLTTIAALASGAYMANQTIANLVNEPNFSSVYQQGEICSVFVLNIDEYCLLTIIFRAHLSVGVVKYFSEPAAQRIAKQLQVAQERAPGQGLDLSEMNVVDSESIFHRK
jgi:predicted regulator of Ras-like GTPase activity (Roadblock/LC7/MglB family)